MPGVLGMRPALRPALTPIAQALRGMGLLGFSMYSLFRNNEQGAWYDPSDFERYMSPKGPELVTNGGFNVGTAGWSTVASTLSWVADGWAKVTATGTQSAQANQVIPAHPVGRWLEVSGSYRNLTASRQAKLTLYSTVDLAVQVGSGSNGTLRASGFIPANTAVTLICLLTGSPVAGDSVEWDNISVRELTNISTATLFQDAAGTTPVTAMEQPVGLMLDKRLGLVRGPELVTNGTFDTNTTGWTANLGTISAVNGALRLVGAGDYPSGRQSFAVTPGATYEVTGLVRSVSGAQAVMLVRPQGFDVSTGQLTTGATTQTTFQQFRGVIVATTATLYVRATINEAASTGVVEFDNISVREIPGNHASQTTTTARPLLSARKNLTVKSEVFADAAWTKFTATVLDNNVTAPDGTLTGSKLVEDNTLAIHAVGRGGMLGSTAAGTTFTGSYYFKAAERTTCSIAVGNGGLTNYARQLFDLSTGTVLGGIQIVGSVSGASASITSVGDGWYRCAVTLTMTVAETNIGTFAYAAAGSNINYQGVTGSGVYLWGAQLEYGATATRYQRINTSTDYDWVGFPMYLKFDGVDDFLSMASVPFLPSDEFIGAYVARRMDAMTTDKPVLAIRNSGQTTSIHFNNAGEALDASVRDDAGLAIRTLANAGSTKVNELASCFTKKQGSTLSLSKNGAAPLTASTAGLGVANNVTTARIGSSANGPGFYNGEIHALVIRKGSFTGNDKAVLRYVANKAGIPL